MSFRPHWIVQLGNDKAVYWIIAGFWTCLCSHGILCILSFLMPFEGENNPLDNVLFNCFFFYFEWFWISWIVSLMLIDFYLILLWSVCLSLTLSIFLSLCLSFFFSVTLSFSLALSSYVFFFNLMRILVTYLFLLHFNKMLWKVIFIIAFLSHKINFVTLCFRP